MGFLTAMTEPRNAIELRRAVDGDRVARKVARGEAFGDEFLQLDRDDARLDFPMSNGHAGIRRSRRGADRVRRVGERDQIDFESPRRVARRRPRRETIERVAASDGRPRRGSAREGNQSPHRDSRWCRRRGHRCLSGRRPGPGRRGDLARSRRRRVGRGRVPECRGGAVRRPLRRKARHDADREQREKARQDHDPTSCAVVLRAAVGAHV